MILLKFFSRKTKKISQTVDAVCLMLKDWESAFLPDRRRNEVSDTFTSLDMSLDDAAHVLHNLRKFFEICSAEDQQKLLTMLPSTWGRDRISSWFGSTEHQARNSLVIRSTLGIFSNVTDNRGNKRLDDEIEQLVQNFYISDDTSRETSNKKEVIYLRPSKTPMPLRFLHLTIGRSKFCALRPVWVREKSTHENCLCLQHANADLLTQVSSEILFKVVFNRLPIS